MEGCRLETAGPLPNWIDIFRINEHEDIETQAWKAINLFEFLDSAASKQ
jgi:hypothetical protein